MLDIDYSLIIQIANFLFLLFLLNIIAYRPIRGILSRRKEEIFSNEEMAEEWKRKADKYSEELDENISETRKEGLKEKENLKNQGMTQEREMLQEAYSSIEEKLDSARVEIRDRISQVSQSLRGELEGFSRELAEKILGRGI